MLRIQMNSTIKAWLFPYFTQNFLSYLGAFIGKWLLLETGAIFAQRSFGGFWPSEFT